MKILKLNRTSGVIEVIPESFDDLWHLQKIVVPSDIIEGSTLRTLKAKDVEQKKEKIRMYLEIRVEKVELDAQGQRIRFLGKIISGKPADLVEVNSYHSLDFEIKEKIRITKRKLNAFEIERLKKAEKEGNKSKIMLITLDDEQADISLVKASGLKQVNLIKNSETSGKRFKQEKKENTFLKKIVEEIKNSDAEIIVIAGPGFTKNYLKKYLEENLRDNKKQMIFESVSEIGIPGYNELMKKKVIEKINENAFIVKENELIENLMKEIVREGLACYGLKECKKAVENGMVEELMITDELLVEKRNELEKYLELTERNKGMVHIISIENEPGKILKGLGSIACLLRYKN